MKVYKWRPSAVHITNRLEVKWYMRINDISETVQLHWFLLLTYNYDVITTSKRVGVFLQTASSHHGGERDIRHPELCLPGSGVRRRCAARKPPAALPEARLGLHAGQLHQVPDRHMGVAHRPRIHLLPVLSARLPLPILALHAEIQNPTGRCLFYAAWRGFRFWYVALCIVTEVCVRYRTSRRRGRSSGHVLRCCCSTTSSSSFL